MAPKKSTEQVPVSATVASSAEKPKKSKKASTEAPVVAPVEVSPTPVGSSTEKPKKSKKASTEAPVVTSVEEQVVSPVETTVVTEKPKRVSKKKVQETTETTDETVRESSSTEQSLVNSEKPKRVSKKKAQNETTESFENTESSETSETSSVPAEKRVRKVVNQETLKVDLEQLKQQVESEILRLRTEHQKNKGSKFLKAVNKSLKVLSSDLNRVLKSKTKSVRNKNTSSGFMKPVKISSEMALFTKWDQSQLYSRVDVTKFLCNYIRTNQLQNPEDRRQILCDDNLSSLLKLDRESQSQLTYPGLQQHIQQHFITDASSVNEEVAHP